MFYVVDKHGRRPEVANGGNPQPFPLSTLEECESAVGYYQEADYPDFPYSIIDADSGETVSTIDLDDP